MELEEQLLERYYEWQDTEDRLTSGIDNENYHSIIQDDNYFKQTQMWLKSHPELLMSLVNFLSLQFNQEKIDGKFFFGGMTTKGIRNESISFKNKPLNETINELSETINFYNHAVWYTANVVKANGKRTQNDVEYFKNFYIDLDLVKSKLEIEDGISILVNTLKNKELPMFDTLIYTGHGLQALWHFQPTGNIELATKINIAIANLFLDSGSDIAVSKDCVRYLRFPYTFNIKKEYPKPSISAVLYTDVNTENLKVSSETFFKKFTSKLDLNNSDSFVRRKKINFSFDPKIKLPKLENKFNTQEEVEQYLANVKNKLPQGTSIPTGIDEAEANSLYYSNNLELFKDFNQGEEFNTTLPKEIAKGLLISGYSLNSLFEILNTQKKIAEEYRKGATTYRNNLLRDRIIVLIQTPDYRPVFVDRLLLNSGDRNKIHQAIIEANAENIKRYQLLYQEINQFNQNQFKEIALPQEEIDDMFRNRDLIYFTRYRNISREGLLDSEGADLPYYRQIIIESEKKLRNKTSVSSNDSIIELNNEIDKTQNETSAEVKEEKTNKNDKASQFKNMITDDFDELSEKEIAFNDEFTSEADINLSKNIDNEIVQNDSNIEESKDNLINDMVYILKKDCILDEADDEKYHLILKQYQDYLILLMQCKNLIIDNDFLNEFQEILGIKDKHEFELKWKVLVDKIEIKTIEGKNQNEY